MNITVSITTRNRYHTTLSLCLLSVINQTLLPYEIILVDDNDKKEFYNIDIYKSILNLMKLKNIKFSYYYGSSNGQVYAQQIALENCETDWMHTIDDDNILNPDVLDILSNTIKDNTGAVSGIIISSDKDKNRLIDEEDGETYNRIENIYTNFNIQTCGNQNKLIKKCQHLYSNYLFNTKLIDKFALEFSPCGQRSETVLTYGIFLKGYDLLMNPNSITYHLNDNIGGNNIYSSNQTNKNEKLFVKKLEEWNIIPHKLKIIDDMDKLITEKNGIKYLVCKI